MQRLLVRTDAMQEANRSNGSHTFFTVWRLQKTVWLSDLEIDTLTNDNQHGTLEDSRTSTHL